MNDLQLRNFNLAYGKKVIINNVSLSLNKSRIGAILGRNGAGKTSFLESAIGIRGRANGEIIFEQRIFSPRSVEWRHGSYLLSLDVPYLENLTVLENLSYFLKLSNHYEIDYSQIIAALEELGMDDAKDKRYALLSKGMKQKVSIVEFLLKKPKVLFMDEPFDGLDIVMQDYLMNFLKRFKNGDTFLEYCLIATHEYDLIKNIVDDMTFISNGKVVARGNIESILKYFKENYIPIKIKNIPKEMVNQISKKAEVFKIRDMYLIPSEFLNEKVIIENFDIKLEDIFWMDKYE